MIWSWCIMGAPHAKRYTTSAAAKWRKPRSKSLHHVENDWYDCAPLPAQLPSTYIRLPPLSLHYPGREERRNPDALLQIDKGGALSKKHVCFDKKKMFRNLLLYQHISGFFPVVLSASHQCCCGAKSSASGLARRTWEWYMYDAQLQWTLACG